MNDMLATIIPKSDQLNADDLIGRSMTIRITMVLIAASAEQPVAVHFEGDGDKPYMVCKSMRRVLVNVWGPDANAYIGRSMTLYRDPAVKFGGLAVGGIRISHMSDIDKPVTMALTETRANRKPFTVKPLVVEGRDLSAEAHEAARAGITAYQAFWKSLTKAQQQGLLPQHEALKTAAVNADADKLDAADGIDTKTDDGTARMET